MSVRQSQSLRRVVIALSIALVAYFVLAISLTWAAPVRPVNSSSGLTGHQRVHNPAPSPDLTLSVSSLPPFGPPAIVARDFITITHSGPYEVVRRTVVLAVGTVECPENAVFSMVVSVQQWNNLATGSTRGICQGTEQAWRISAEAIGRSRFEAGGARACVLVYARLEDGSIEREQTCRIVRLVAASQ
jgi:hypothetical protein